MCILQLREDGELCEVVRRHRRDVNRLELLAQLAYRSPHERPRANPRRSADALHRGESHAAEFHHRQRLLQRDSRRTAHANLARYGAARNFASGSL